MMGAGNQTIGPWVGTSAAALDSIGLDWDLLTDSAFGVDYQNT
jgi:hypothetical protein